MSQESGLRARKRFRTMRHIQQVGLDLFERHGFEAVTIERVAAEAEVSPSSVYRYFDTKEGIVLWNPAQDTLATLLAEDQGDLPLLEAMRHMVAGYLADSPEWDEAPDRRRLRLLMESPALWTAGVARVGAAADTVSHALAKRAHTSPTDFETQVASGAILGALLSAVRHWHAGGCVDSVPDVVDRVFATLQEGLDLR